MSKRLREKWGGGRLVLSIWEKKTSMNRNNWNTLHGAGFNHTTRNNREDETVKE